MKQETYPNPEQFKGQPEGSKLAGGFFIVMGGIFLLAASGVTFLGQSLWVLAALLPVYWIGAAAYRRYKEDGGVSGRVFAILAFGLLPFAYVAAAILGFNVGAIWPVGLIALGISFIVFGTKK